MKKIFKQLFLGKPLHPTHPAYKHHHAHTSSFNRVFNNIKAIWNNDHHQDIGIEKILRLFLACSQLFFFATYLKHFFGRDSPEHRDLLTDIFVLIKMLSPILVLYFDLQNNNVLFYIILWFFFETTLYIPTLIFASDIFSPPRSYRRAMLLLFLNYIEIMSTYALIYARGNFLNKPIENYIDALYFSLITASSIGYGDMYPVTSQGKLLVISQSILFLAFVVLFLNFFSNKVETSKGYFSNKY